MPPVARFALSRDSVDSTTVTRLSSRTLQVWSTFVQARRQKGTRPDSRILRPSEEQSKWPTHRCCPCSKPSRRFDEPQPSNGVEPWWRIQTSRTVTNRLLECS